MPRDSSGGLQVSAAYAGELGYKLMLFLPLVHHCDTDFTQALMSCLYMGC